MNKEEVVHKYDGILFSYKKERNAALTTTWINPEVIMLSEISSRERKIVYDLTSGI